MPVASAATTSYHRWLIAVLILVVALMVGGGLGVRRLYRLPDASPARTLPSSTALPLGEQPGPDTVELTEDAAAHPEHGIVRSLLQDYFSAINRRDYDAWKGTVSQARVAEKPRAKFQQEYQTTQDGSILVYRIESLSNEDLRVFLAFTSTQDPSTAPRELPETCVRWKLVFPLTVENGKYRVSSVAGFAPTELSSC